MKCRNFALYTTTQHKSAVKWLAKMMTTGQRPNMTLCVRFFSFVSVSCIIFAGRKCIELRQNEIHKHWKVKMQSVAVLLCVSQNWIHIIVKKKMKTIWWHYFVYAYMYMGYVPIDICFVFTSVRMGVVRTSRHRPNIKMLALFPTFTINRIKFPKKRETKKRSKVIEFHQIISMTTLFHTTLSV